MRRMHPTKNLRCSFRSTKPSLPCKRVHPHGASGGHHAAHLLPAYLFPCNFVDFFISGQSSTFLLFEQLPDELFLLFQGFVFFLQCCFVLFQFCFVLFNGDFSFDQNLFLLFDDT